MKNPHAVAAGALLQHLQVGAARGLDEAQVRQRLQRYGPNAMAARRVASAFRLWVHQFASPVVYLLGAAAALALWFGDREESAAIAVVLGINALIGFVTELKAVRSMEALRALGSRTARVRREGHERIVPAEMLVPGDIVLLDAGDAVSADLRLIEASNLSTDESALTGESVAVDKRVEPVGIDARLGDRASMLMQGTSVTRGSGVGVVVATGLQTELGRVTQLVEEANPGSSPLERKLSHLSAQLVWATLAIAVVIAVFGLRGDNARVVVESAIALAVAAIPEGLAIVATLALARGMWRMARKSALIERLSAVETLGATTLILTDKTGTLTENRMAVSRLWTSAGELDVQSGAVGKPGVGGKSIGRQLKGNREAEELLHMAVLCNDAALESAADRGTGDPMEVALLRAGLLAGLVRPTLLVQHRQVRKHAFDSAARMMATVHESGDGYLFAVKGAPEAVLAACTRSRSDRGEAALDPASRARWQGHAEEMARDGLRVLACAMKMDTKDDGEPYQGLVLLGLIGLQDPARADVPAAIRDCRKAGIRVVMVTGDHAVTARSIGRSVGLDERAQNVVEGQHIAATIEAGPLALREVGIFARVSPAEKLQLVRAYQASGEVVAMTGDGVNDAPALRQADIGVAMGLRGTDVARQAAAMVLLDDAFPTIVRAIGEGRVIFANIRRFVMYLLACNLSEVIVIGAAVLLSLPLPLLPLQILYLNLVTDVFPAFALAMGEGERGILQRPPRDPAEPLLGRRQWTRIVLHGGTLSAATFGALAATHWLGMDRAQSVTVTFLTLAFAQLWHVLNMRHPDSGLFDNEVTRNRWVWVALALCAALLVLPPYLGDPARLLQVEPPTLQMWSVVLVSSLAPVLVVQLAMTLVGRRTGVGA